MNYKELHAATAAQCERYVEAFCKIMGYTEDGYMPEHYFIGSRTPDIFGVVCISDMFFNMSDLCTVIGEYDRWQEMYGNELPKVVEEWYWYHINDSEKWSAAPYQNINLEHWLMGARPTEEATSQAYKEQQAKELAEAHAQTEQAKQDLWKAIEDEYHRKMSYPH